MWSSPRPHVLCKGCPAALSVSKTSDLPSALPRPDLTLHAQAKQHTANSGHNCAQYSRRSAQHKTLFSQQTARLVTCISAVSLPRGMSAKPSRVPARLLSFFLLRSAVRNCRNPLLLQHTMLAGMLQIWHRTHEFEKQVPALGSSAQPKQPGLSSLSSLAARCIQAGARRACTCRPWLDRGSRPLCQRRSPQYTGCRPQSCRRRSPGRTTAARGRNRSAARGQLLVTHLAGYHKQTATWPRFA